MYNARERFHYIRIGMDNGHAIHCCVLWSGVHEFSHSSHAFLLPCSRVGEVRVEIDLRRRNQESPFQKTFQRNLHQRPDRFPANRGNHRYSRDRVDHLDSSLRNFSLL